MPLTSTAHTDWDDATYQLYEALAGLSQPTRALLQRQGFPPAVIDLHLPRLSALGMAQELTDGTIVVTPPEVALPRYAAELELAAGRSRARVQELSERFTQARDEAEAKATVGVRMMVDLTELARVRSQVLSGARSSIIVVATRTELNEELLLDLRAPWLTRGEEVRRICVFDSSVLDLPRSAEALESLDEAGVQVRLRPGLALGIVVVDRSVAIVDVSSHDSTGYGSIVVRHRPLVEALAQLAEATYAASRTPPRPSSAARGHYGDREARVLALLSAGAADSTVARQLGISQRTVERDIRKMMDDLNATTRFQAGVQAARRGLV